MTTVNLIVVADEPAIFFASVRDAERWMEPVDVQDGVYTAAFGPAGEPYTISTDGHGVSIEPTGEASNPEALQATLLRFFTALGEQTDGGMTLSDMLDRCVPSYP